MIDLAGRKIDRVQFHVGVGNLARTGMDRVREKAEMQITPAGVYVKIADGEYVVPYSNVTWCKLVSDGE